MIPVFIASLNFNIRRNVLTILQTFWSKLYIFNAIFCMQGHPSVPSLPAVFVLAKTRHASIDGPEKSFELRLSRSEQSLSGDGWPCLSIVKEIHSNLIIIPTELCR